MSQGGTLDTFGTGHTVLARVKQGQGNSTQALTAIQRAMQIARSLKIPRILSQISAHRARIWLAQGKLKPAASWARDYGQAGETQYLREYEDLTLARVLLAEHKPSQALHLLDAVLAPAEDAGRTGTAIEALALRALALDALGEESRASSALERALELAEPEGYVRVFVDEREPMATLLRAWCRSNPASSTTAYAGKLLAAFTGPAPAHLEDRPSPTSQSSPLVEPLTEREMEVLSHLAERLTNPEIAHQLTISLSTVKSHVRNIYGKLGVHSRRQAVAKARALGILLPRQ